MHTIKLKPLSVNKAFKGRRFKTEDYNIYERITLLWLPDIIIPEPPFKVSFVFGFSSKGSDVDNPVKPFLDILQKKYGINDKDVYEMHLKKKDVEKGKEFIQFKIESL